jgi:hypothetical protein
VARNLRRSIVHKQKKEKDEVGVGRTFAFRVEPASNGRNQKTSRVRQRRGELQAQKNKGEVAEFVYKDKIAEAIEREREREREREI